MKNLNRFRSSSFAVFCTAVIAVPPPLYRPVLPQAAGPDTRTAAARSQAGAPTQAGTQPQTTATKPQPAGTQPQPAGAQSKTPPAAPPPDLGWPRTYPAVGGTITLHQPQIASWDDRLNMVAWSAVAYQPKGATEQKLGVVKIEAKTRVALDERLVSFSSFSIGESNFPTLSRDTTREVVTGLQAAIPDGERIIALDRVLEAVDASKIRPKEVPGIKADPPKVFFSTTPAVLVNIDGAVVWSPIDKVDLRYAVNTNWDLFEHPPSSTFYLRNETSWYKAPALEGPWTPAGQLPSSFSKLPANDNFKDVRSNIPGRTVAAKAMPQVFVSTESAELLLLKGQPAYEPVESTALQWVNNTESDLFRLGKDGPFFYLVAGRWFQATDPNGPWTFATTTLPEDFRKIPLEHPRSRVLASVPGTAQANEAVLLATVPQTARISRKQLEAPDVVYQGQPQFEEIPGTSVARATNTDKDIIKVGDVYYMCFQAVWFMSRSPSGPWEVATTVPKEIYSIPASSPAHNVTYVTVVEEDSDDDWVTFAYVAGYTGMMVAWGCAVWGSGWYYPPYVGYGGFYPVYYGYPRTYGYSAWYNPYTGGYGRGMGAYGPYGGAGMGAVYNPRTGTYARGAAAYGPYGSRGVAQAYNPRTGTYAATRQGSNVYGNWGSSYVQRGDNWARTGHTTNYRTGATTRGIETSSGAGAVTRSGAAGRTTVGRTAGGDVYAGHDGNVYRRGSDGSWESHNNGNWTRPSPTTRDSNTNNQLNRDAAARRSGEQRTQSASTYRSSPSRSAAGSYRGGGGRGRGR